MAFSFWEEALSTAISLDKDSDWDAGLIRYSIAYLLHRKGDRTAGHAMLSEAEKSLQGGERIYWINRFQSGWYDVILQQMNEMCPSGCRDCTPATEM